MRKESRYNKSLIDLAEVLLEDNNTLSIKLSGNSMFPSLKEDDICFEEKCRIEDVKIGDIIACRSGNFLIMHRLKRMKKVDERNILETRGDNILNYDPPFTEDQFVAKLICFERNGKIHQVDSPTMKFMKFMDDYFHPVTCRISKVRLLQKHTFNWFRKSSKSISTNIHHILRGSEKLFRINSLINILQGLVPLAILVFIKYLVDYLTGTAFRGMEERLFFYLLLGATALLFLAGSVLNLLRDYYSEKMSQSVTRKVYDELHQKHISLDLSGYENPDKQDKMHRAVQEASFRPVKILNALLGCIKAVGSGVILIGLFVSIRWYLILILLAAVIPDVFVRLIHTRKRYQIKDSQTTKEREKYYYNRVLTGFPFAKELRLFGFSGFFLKRFRKTQDELFDENLSLRRTELKYTIFAEIFAVILIFGSMGFVAYLKMNGVMTIGTVVLFFFAFQRGYSVLNEFFRSVTQLIEDNTFLEDLIEFLNLKEKQENIIASKPFSLQKEVCFEHVSFRYDESQRDALKNINIRIPAGKTVALVGENGSGKSTLIKLLCGFYEPDSGSILFDDVDARQIGGETIRENMTAVFQDFALYQLSAMQNILLGDLKKQADAEKAKLAAKTAGIDETLENLPGGYHTLLGNLFKGGEELSIGQWQKMAIARAFYRDSPLLLLDEPSSALDAVSERQMISSLQELAKDKTTLIVSHRLSTVQWADLIYLLEDGEQAEMGTHVELMAKKGKYYSLFEKANGSPD